MKNKSRVVAFRLNPRNAMEKRALQIIEEQENLGINPRQFFTDLALRYEGITPEMYKRDFVKSNPYNTNDMAQHIEDVIENKMVDVLQDFEAHIIQSILGAIGEESVPHQFAEKQYPDDVPTEYESELIEAIMSRRQEGK